MPTQLQIFRSFVFAGLVSGVAVFAISEGAEPTTVATAAILAVALFGGVEVRELAAVRRGLAGSGDPDGDESGRSRE